MTDKMTAPAKPAEPQWVKHTDAARRVGVDPKTPKEAP